MWDNVLNKPEYLESHDGVPSFLGSNRFKCIVKDSLLSIFDSFPTEFKTADCNPGISNIVNIVEIDPTTVEVEITPSEFVHWWIQQIKMC